MPEENPKPESRALKLEKLKEFTLPSAVLALAATPDGKRLFAACQGGGVFVGDGQTGKFELLGQHESYASGVALLPDGNTLISAGYDGCLQWHDVTARKTVRKIT